ncbi:MAG TPA: type II secretion system protein [Candidatus Gracilibacteria bacterium]
MVLTKIKTQGFTLIELLIVLVIIGVLLGITIPSFSRYQQRTQLIAAHVSLRNALEEAFSGSRSEPQTFAIRLQRGQDRFARCVQSDPSDPSTRVCTDVLFSPGVVIRTAESHTAWATTDSANGTNAELFIVFEPPYGAVSFEGGVGVSNTDFYYLELHNPSPLSSYFRIWASGLIEAQVDD